MNDSIWFSLSSAVLAIMLSSARQSDTLLGRIASKWNSPADSRIAGAWPVGLSKGILPVPCPSHNDYWRHAPLYSALAVGCTGIEADLWLQDNDLLVGHSKASLRLDWTLRQLYLDPLLDMLQGQNPQKNLTTESSLGIFETMPNTTVVLMFDFKFNGTDLWPVVVEQTQQLRKGNWLSYWDADSQSLVVGPITLVASGDAPFDLVVASDFHDIFYDAPLNDLDAWNKYNQSNSYYASASINAGLGKVFFKLTDG